MINIAVCDDEAGCVSRLEEMINRYMTDAGVAITPFLSGEELIKSIEQGCYYDIIFLDIEMPGMDGLETGIRLRDKYSIYDSLIIYVTSHSEYIRGSFKAHAFSFIEKPTSEENLYSVLKDALRCIQNQDSVFEYRRGKGEICRRRLEDIWYFDKARRKIDIVSAHWTDCYTGTLDELEQSLKKRHADNFVRVHRCSIANINHAVKIHSHGLVYDNNVEIPISDSYRKAVEEQLAAYKRRRH